VEPAESTTHFCVCDAEGNTVSVTQTLMSLCGARVVAPETGILLNNGMMWFDPEPGRPNSIAPGKKGLNNMCPAVLVTPAGEPCLAVGASGGRRILNCVAQLVCNVVDFDMDIQQAINAPRLDTSAGLVLDARLPEHVVEALRRRGHTPELQHAMPYPRFFASPVGIQRRGGTTLGGVDPHYFTASAWGA
jgi:gamma-glutamyltranspeptidase/glutathione hydrolase